MQDTIQEFIVIKFSMMFSHTEFYIYAPPKCNTIPTTALIATRIIGDQVVFLDNV